MATRTLRSAAPVVALSPTILIVLFAYVGTMGWTVWMSFTGSRLLPVNTLVGTQQYERLFGDARWLISLQNMALFGVLFIGFCLVLGFLLAVAIDQRVRGEDGLRTIFLYPHAMSFIVTGLVWQWMMNPTLGIQEAVQAMGWESFRFDWVVRRDMAIYAVVIAGVWQSAGLVMALMLAGLRGVDEDLWKAARVDGIPPWRVYTSIVLPLLKPMIITSVVLLSIAVVKVYDLVVALTNGGPGTSTAVPAKYVMDYLFERQNIGLAAAASTVLLVTVLCVLAPWIYAEYFRKERGGA
ncbi:carbohydrate ABC transporter permease [Aureimonas phyllosphaerae]|uniref:Glucose/mannose transport system permease protein n=1 Tax=Aureimonas phyllosphaerae TaxID=1166078 RepID=A0A7W6BMG4_9HYPH|nr:sugar ABC transporter permease [Aureimonas phyllosphaerae]MBB3934684.1 glucose/mannose transport system permease protein [Aureimonas phyllosphaerae]MBB3958100.1 glucose/mannose transport system permease protein [Aureimonas phyllosphaerae]SFE91819.1 carbohydrate ABC transporter membrane protein 1, CUT1 family [Aureimonas phyllosphaerae]